jgi:protein gp37
MSTLENQEVWDRDYPKLMRVPAAWHGVSAEPLLGPIDMRAMIERFGRIDWMITGGESGPKRRDLDMVAVRAIRDQCAEFGVTFHHKQNGGLRGKDTGCLVDGVEHKHFPAALAA